MPLYADESENVGLIIGISLGVSLPLLLLLIIIIVVIITCGRRLKGNVTSLVRGMFRGGSKVSGNQSSDVTFEPIIFSC